MSTNPTGDIVLAVMMILMLVAAVGAVIYVAYYFCFVTDKPGRDNQGRAGRRQAEPISRRSD